MNVAEGGDGVFSGEETIGLVLFVLPPVGKEFTPLDTHDDVLLEFQVIVTVLPTGTVPELTVRFTLVVLGAGGGGATGGGGVGPGGGGGVVAETTDTTIESELGTPPFPQVIVNMYVPTPSPFNVWLPPLIFLLPVQTPTGCDVALQYVGVPPVSLHIRVVLNGAVPKMLVAVNCTIGFAGGGGGGNVGGGGARGGNTLTCVVLVVCPLLSEQRMVNV